MIDMRTPVADRLSDEWLEELYKMAPDIPPAVLKKSAIESQKTHDLMWKLMCRIAKISVHHNFKEDDKWIDRDRLVSNLAYTLGQSLDNWWAAVNIQMQEQARQWLKTMPPQGRG